ncbi:MAG: radical SAM protein [Sphingomonadales bacterium]|nr:radical SAM protein [Sphingomonadales bacterium]
MTIALPLTPAAPPLDPAKFRDPRVTATGEARAEVAFQGLKILWFNTGTLCNLECAGCYIESSPKNDRLAYLTATEARAFFEEIARDHLPVEDIGLTGGEPFMNPDIFDIMGEALGRGFRVLVLTNALRPMLRFQERLLALHRAHAGRLTVRVSIDHPEPERHERLRGPGSWTPMIKGVRWLIAHGFTVHVAGRTVFGEPQAELRAAYARLFAELGLAIDANDPAALVLFPEMDASRDVPEITTACWGILGVRPEDMMCASSRMVIKRRGAASPAVVACTLLPYDPQFELGPTLAAAARPVALNHPHCARFCVLGGASCSR